MIDIENLKLLFSDNRKEIYQALYEKKDWINRKLILNGCLDYYLDEQGKKRFFFLENLFDNVVAFNPVHYENNRLQDWNIIRINEDLQAFKRAKFKTKIDLTSGAPFFVEYDFNKLDELGYKTLFANFYFNHPEADLCIDLESDPMEAIDLIKICLIGREDECSIILTDDNLLNGVYYLPIVSKIYIAKAIEDELFKTLEEYCKRNNVEMEVISEKR